MILVEDDRVLLTRNDKRYTVWVQCPDCGPTPPATRIVPHAISGEPVTEFSAYMFDKLVCSVCGREGERREALVPNRTAEGKCGARCWNGKLICACICEGKCHGEGKCYCKVAA
ncbi:hypothetical protein LCGC14_2697270 [marine sediment metagenome]|uniref:Uncharacterized protein n=1 Tax=marine sediment metagenome TaxID=412755 RepID=A0A0F9BR81_9ZZZZ